MFTNLRSLLFSKRAIRIYVIEVFFLAASAFGLGHGAHDFFAGGAINITPLIYMVLGGITPLTIFVFIAVNEAVLTTQKWASASYQYRIDELQKRLNAQDDFYGAINNNMPTTLTIYDKNNAYWFLNASAEKELGMPGKDILGQKPTEVMGPRRGTSVLNILDQVRKTAISCKMMDEYKDAHGETRYVQTSYQALSPFGEFPGGIMARGDNVTSIVTERTRRETMLRQVISTLVGVVDRRDPYAAGHSAHVGFLSRALAAEMNLSEREIEAAEIAGSLMNFGKVLVSRSILTKIESLTPEELQRIRDGILTSADILSPIDFGLPVVITLRQVMERFDGKGAPAHLKGDAILLSARIVAVANAFVALVSPRAYRAGLDVPQALRNLNHDADKAYDPQVVAALKTYLDKNAAHIEWLATKK